VFYNQAVTRFPYIPRAGPRERLVVGWSGMRRAVSLAAALALPLQTRTGQGFPPRDLIIFRPPP
jgi:CPA1 family monovalent cation:H+ antiporter